MSGLTLIFTVIGYVSVAIFIVGFLARVWKYATTPAPLRIALKPAPVGSTGVIYRMFQEVGFFKSLFHSNKILWIGAYIFHLGLLIVLLKNLRFFFASTPAAITYIATFEIYAGFIMLLPPLFFFALRLVIDRALYISVMTDYLLLALLIVIAAKGVLTKYFVRVDIIAIKQFAMGFVTFNPQAMPGEIILSGFLRRRGCMSLESLERGFSSYFRVSSLHSRFSPAMR